jgi:DNA polymerase sigma
MLQFPLEEEIVAAAGINASKIDYKNLPEVDKDLKLDDETKKAMEADPVYKMLEDKFYKVFDKHIIGHTSRIGSNIDGFRDEREFVKNRIETIARDVLNCERIVIKVFGSLVTGLALESSDMDMAVTGLDICDRTTLIEDLNTLSDALD